jgi:glycosyltransferase involved in cell wall biosynthesis
MRIAFAAAYDPRDVTSWSGTPFFMVKGLEAAGAAVEIVAPLPEYRPLIELGKKAFHRAAGRRHLSNREPKMLRHWAHELERRLAGSQADVVVSSDSTPVTHLESDLPIVVWTDATFDALVGFYPEFSNLSASSIENGRRQELAALDRVALAVYSSRWAAEGAREYYGVDDDRLAVVPYGANIEPPSAAEVSACVDSRSSDVCRLVFIASDWFRKGGDVAVDAVGLVNEAGVPAELTIVGAPPHRPDALPPYANYVGIFDKRSRGAGEMGELIGGAHFLLLPTRADCSPVVLAEASAWGTPSLAPDVGGVGELVVDGVNGWLLEPAAGPEKYASAILAGFEDPTAYRELALSSHREYERRLNWKTAGGEMVRLLEGVAAPAA